MQIFGNSPVGIPNPRAEMMYCSSMFGSSAMPARSMPSNVTASIFDPNGPNSVVDRMWANPQISQDTSSLISQSLWGGCVVGSCSVTDTMCNSNTIARSSPPMQSSVDDFRQTLHTRSPAVSSMPAVDISRVKAEPTSPRQRPSVPPPIQNTHENSPPTDSKVFSHPKTAAAASQSISKPTIFSSKSLSPRHSSSSEKGGMDGHLPNSPGSKCSDSTTAPESPVSSGLYPEDEVAVKLEPNVSARNSSSPPSSPSSPSSSRGSNCRRPGIEDESLEKLCDLQEFYSCEKFSKLLVDFHEGISFPLGEGGRELLRACLNAKGCKGKKLQGASVPVLLQLANDWGLWNVALRIKIERTMGELSAEHDAFVRFKANQSQTRKHVRREYMQTDRDCSGKIRGIHFEEMKSLTLGKEGREALRTQLRRLHDKEPEKMDFALEKHGFKYSELRNATVSQLIKMAYICGIWDGVVEACRKQEEKKDSIAPKTKEEMRSSDSNNPNDVNLMSVKLEPSDQHGDSSFSNPCSSLDPHVTPQQQNDGYTARAHGADGRKRRKLAHLARSAELSNLSQSDPSQSARMGNHKSLGSTIGMRKYRIKNRSYSNGRAMGSGRYTRNGNGYPAQNFYVPLTGAPVGESMHSTQGWNQSGSMNDVSQHYASMALQAMWPSPVRMNGMGMSWGDSSADNMIGSDPSMRSGVNYCRPKRGMSQMQSPYSLNRTVPNGFNMPNMMHGLNNNSVPDTSRCHTSPAVSVGQAVPFTSPRKEHEEENKECDPEKSTTSPSNDDDESEDTDDDEGEVTFDMATISQMFADLDKNVATGSASDEWRKELISNLASDFASAYRDDASDGDDADGETDEDYSSPHRIGQR